MYSPIESTYSIHITIREVVLLTMHALAEKDIRERIVSFQVDDLQMHSDHCPLLLKLNTGTSYSNKWEETRILSEVLLED